MELENTIGYTLAMGFKPFIDPRCKEHMEIVKDMAKSINTTFKYQINPCDDLKMRVKQFLTSLDYALLTDFQAKCVLLLEQELKK